MKFVFIRDLDGEVRRKPRKDRIPISLLRGTRRIPQRILRLAETKPVGSRKENTELTEVIKKIHEDHKGRLGIDRLVAELAKLGRQHSPRRVRRLARAAGLT